MKKIFCILCVLISCSVEVRPVKKPVVAVYAAWKFNQYGLEQIPWSRFSHIAIASVYPREDATLESTAVDGFIQKCVELAKQHNKKVILSVGGAGEGSKAFRRIMAQPALAQQFVNNLVAYAKHHKVDGVDIDWEYWTLQSEHNQGGNDPIESQYLLELVKAVRVAVGPQMFLSVDIAPGEWLGGQYKLELQEFADYVNLMAFDFTGAWPSSKVGHHADYAMFVKAIQHTLDRGFHKEKLLVGLPAYGVEFIDGKNLAIRHVGFNEIATLAVNNAQALENGQINNIYFDTKEQFARKARYVTANGLAGVFVFDLASDVLDDKRSLMYSLKQYILIDQDSDVRQ